MAPIFLKAYNPSMGTQAGSDLDAWLRDGGVVVASSDRAARALEAGFHRRRRLEGLAVWPSPAVTDWKALVLNAWRQRVLDSRLLLSPAQEQQIWSEIIHSDQHLPTSLPASIRRLSAMAMDAHVLLCSYAPRYLEDNARIGWDQDTGVFSQWLSEFDHYCRKNQLVSQSRAPLELIRVLARDSSPRPMLLILGFDRLLPVQHRLFDAWGSWQRVEKRTAEADPRFYLVRDAQSELEACAWWSNQRLAADPDRRLLVVTQDLGKRRGEIERAFLRFNPPGAPPLFELSLGLPLSTVPLARSALLLLRWISGSLTENEVDWLFRCGHLGAADEQAMLEEAMRRLRYRDRQRVEWTINSLVQEMTATRSPATSWTRRMREAEIALKGSERYQNHVEWAGKVPQLLATMGWPGAPSEGTDFEVLRRWEHALDTAGSLGFRGQRVSCHDFLTELENVAAEILFAPESSGAPIQIVGPAESAGLTADAIWFLGADEDAWPAAARMHPFLPPRVQREASMPHASPALDWEFSFSVTRRLIASAPVVYFSFAAQKEDVDSRPSRLVAHLTGAPENLPLTMVPPLSEPADYSEYRDSSSVSFPLNHLKGGAGVLSSQSQCPFKAFAEARLAAASWDFAEAGLSAKQRGQILHDLLRSIWSGKRPGIRNHRDLAAIKDLAAFVRTHVSAILPSGFPPGIEERMPRMYLDLEQTRLVRLVAEWLKFEQTRLAFSVEETESERPVTIAGLSINLRLDRVDRLHDGSQLVIDYKTGNVDPRSWDLPRPDDVQLPLYKLFGLEPLQPSLFENYGGPASGGLAFAKVRSGDARLEGRVADAKQTLDPALSSNSALVKRKLTALEESGWRKVIEKLARDFLDGRADVDPRDYPKTCQRCGLQSLCRIQEPENRERLKEEETEGAHASEE